MSLHRESKIIIDHTHLLDNLDLIMALAPKSRCIAMVKANAYGHGALSIAQTLAPYVEGFGVCAYQEALSLRQAGIQSRIILMQGVFSQEEQRLAADLNLELVVHEGKQLEWLLSAKTKYSKPIWLKANTGMYRLGFDSSHFLFALETLQKQGYRPILMTHLACADDPDQNLNTRQLDEFKQLTYSMALEKSCLNSAGILNFPESQYDYIRPGIALYGVSPCKSIGTPYAKLKAVMSFEARVISIQKVPKGGSVGYGSMWTANQDSRIAIVSVGYGDGYPRAYTDGLPVLINDRIYPSVGAVSMDMMAVDISEGPSVQLGECVRLWGEGNPVEEVALSCQRISYELVTGIAQRVSRQDR